MHDSDTSLLCKGSAAATASERQVDSPPHEPSVNSQLTDVAETQRFLLAIYDPLDKILIRPTETWNEASERRGKPVKLRKSRVVWKHSRHHRVISLTKTTEELQNLLAVCEREKANVFYSVCPRFATPMYKGTYDLAWQVRIVRVLWADLDNCTVEEALLRCKAAGLPYPSIIVSSGHGVHLYWLLDTPYLIDDVGDPPVCYWRKVEGKNGKGRRVYYIKSKDGTEDDPPDLSPKAEHVQHVIAGVAARINGDHTQDLARLLRLPGSLNRKDERNGAEPKPCTLVECEPARRYPFSTFEAFAEASPAVQAEKTVTLRTDLKLTVKREKQLADLLAECETAADRSLADYAACCWAIERGVSESNVYDRCKDVGKFGERGKDYFDLTWTKCQKRTRLKLYLREQARNSSPTNGHTEGKTTPPEAAPPIAHDPEEEERRDDLLAPRLTDRGNARRLVGLHGEQLRYCHPWCVWLVWDAMRWRMDDAGLPMTWAKDVVESLFNLARDEVEALRADLKSDKENEEKKDRLSRIQKILNWALKSEGAPRLNAMVELTRSERCIPVLPEQLDSDPFLLNVLNGTLDLRTGKLREHRPSDLITKLAPVEYHPEAKCPLWERVVGEIFEHDADLIEYMQMVTGRCLTGDVSEQMLPILYGIGGNGKSIWIKACLDILGTDYAGKAAPDLLMARSGERHPCERADLFGKRLVVMSESDQGGKLNQTLIKELTGGEPLKARRMRENFWEFKPTFKIFYVTNFKPVVPVGCDTATWRRLRLIPFTVRFYDPAEGDAGTVASVDAGSLDAAIAPPGPIADKQLDKKLEPEYPGILAWLVRGCLAWQRRGLTLPAKVRVATAEYRNEQDLLAQWMEECCVRVTGIRGRASALLDSYNAWLERDGGDTVSTRAMSDQLTAAGFTKTQSNGVWYEGISVRQNTTEGGGECF